MAIVGDVVEIREELRSHLAGILYCEADDVADDATFEDLGLDSILGLELIAMVNTRYGLTEPLESVYEYPTLGEFSMYVRDRAGHEEKRP